MSTVKIGHDGQTITCSTCGTSEIKNGNGVFEKFEVRYERNHNIVNPSAANPDMIFFVRCFTCRKEVKL